MKTSFNESFKGFIFFWKGIKAAKKEMWVSVQVLFVITLVLAVILFFIEHAAQPDKWTNLWDAFVWGFMSYLGNPGNFSPGEPVTIIGRFISIIIAVIKILIFAIPAGLVANGFRTAMSEDKAAKKNKENADKIRTSFYVHCSLLNGTRFWPKLFFRFNELKMNLDLSESDIIDAVKSTSDLCLRDLSTFLDNTNGVKPEMMAVEMQHTNSDYGFCSVNDYDDFPKVQSSVTLVCPAGKKDAGLNYFTYQLARIGHFNTVISNVLSSNSDIPENRCIVTGIHDYQYNDKDSYPKLRHFVDDIKKTVSGNDAWAIVISSVSSPKTDKEKQNKIQLYVNVAEESENNSLKDCTTVNDTAKLQEFYDDLCKRMSAEHDITPVIVYKKITKTRLQRYIHEKFGNITPNTIEIRLADDYRIFGSDVKSQYGPIKTLSEVIRAHFETQDPSWTTENWTIAEAKQYRSKMIPAHKGEQ